MKVVLSILLLTGSLIMNGVCQSSSIPFSFEKAPRVFTPDEERQFLKYAEEWERNREIAQEMERWRIEEEREDAIPGLRFAKEHIVAAERRAVRYLNMGRRVTIAIGILGLGGVMAFLFSKQETVRSLCSMRRRDLSLKPLLLGLATSLAVAGLAAVFTAFVLLPFLAAGARRLFLQPALFGVGLLASMAPGFVIGLKAKRNSVGHAVICSAVILAADVSLCVLGKNAEDTTITILGMLFVIPLALVGVLVANRTSSESVNP